jgi:putative heme iron utilization protein
MADPTQAKALRRLLEGQDVAALGTLHDGKPFVSMVPYALLPAGRGLVIHVSNVADHTHDMNADPAVSILVMAVRKADVSPEALARVTLECEARPCPPADVDHAPAREAYLSRFPGSAGTLSFASFSLYDFSPQDFSLFVLVPASLRFVDGFSHAWSMTGESFAEAMSHSGAA